MMSEHEAEQILTYMLLQKSKLAEHWNTTTHFDSTWAKKPDPNFDLTKPMYMASIDGIDRNYMLNK